MIKINNNYQINLINNNNNKTKFLNQKRKKRTTKRTTTKKEMKMPSSFHLGFKEKQLPMNKAKKSQPKMKMLAKMINRNRS